MLASQCRAVRRRLRNFLGLRHVGTLSLARALAVFGKTNRGTGFVLSANTTLRSIQAGHRSIRLG